MVASPAKIRIRIRSTAPGPTRVCAVYGWGYVSGLGPDLDQDPNLPWIVDAATAGGGGSSSQQDRTAASNESVPRGRGGLRRAALLRQAVEEVGMQVGREGTGEHSRAMSWPPRRTSTSYYHHDGVLYGPALRLKKGSSEAGRAVVQRTGAKVFFFKKKES